MRPLIAKSLRYHLRCNRVRYSLLMTGPLLLFITYMGNRAGSDSVTLLLSFMFIAGFFSTLVMSVNFFGWEAQAFGGIHFSPLHCRRSYARIALPPSCWGFWVRCSH